VSLVPQPEVYHLELTSLRAGRTGLTPAFGECLAEAASVCFNSEGHSSPTEMPLRGSFSASTRINWEAPSEQSVRCWSDEQVATEHGAYGIAALVVETRGLEIVQRSKKGTGFDYWLGAQGEPFRLFQGLSRLEVSGIRRGSDSEINTRVRKKENQTKTSDGELPAIVVVVEFTSPSATVLERCVT